MERLLRVTKGILLGMMVDLFGSFVLSILLGLLLSLYLTFQGVDSSQLTSAMSEMALTPFWLGLSVIFGALMSVAAGFVAANQIQREYSNPLGVMGTFLALISFTSTLDVLGATMSILFALVTLCAVLAGGWLYDWATR